MSNEQSIRDEARAYIHKKHPEWHDNGVGIVQGSHYRSGFADGAEWALTDSPVIRRIQAEALRDHAKAVAHWEGGHSPRILSHSVERIVADLNDRADRIERGETA